MIFEGINGVPKFETVEFEKKQTKYCLCIPVINESARMSDSLRRALSCGANKKADIIVCDGGSNDGCTDKQLLTSLGVNTLLVKRESGHKSAQLRMGIYYALQRGYEGIITVAGNNKDSIEDIDKFIQKLDEGYDLVQGSRFIEGGKSINTPPLRYLGIRLVHAPIISAAANFKFTDTTNSFRAYSKRYLQDERVQPLRDIFQGYELPAYLEVRASLIGMNVIEVPVTRAYPQKMRFTSKIYGFKGNLELLKILINTKNGKFNP